jgi:pentatricopeptide repeat protein
MVFGSLFDEALKKKAEKVTREAEKSDHAKKKKRKRRGSKRKVSEADDVNRTGDPEPANASPPPQPSNKRPRFEKREPPGKEALELSARLKEFSSRKRLDDALTLYRSKANDGIRDSHHACSVIDCAARCGAISEGERIFDEMKKEGMPITVETYTALLKGYAHAGMMHKGAALFEEVCQRGNPNARSLNTLLRGCLWTASTFENNKVAGGVVTSEIAWKRAGKFNQDASSFDYYITQLCQAMRLDDADREISRLNQVMKIKVTRGSKGDSYHADDPSALESLSICLLAFARAKAMLGLNCARHAAQSALNAVDSAKRGVGLDGTGSSSNNAQGGKRSWKPDAGGQRTASNTLYRGHRLAEVRKEATIVLDFLKKSKQNEKCAAKTLCNLLITRLFCISGGGSTALPTRNNKSKLESSEGDRVFRELMTTKWISFGLKASFLAFEARDDPSFANLTVLNSQQCEVILERLGLQNVTSIDPDGYIPFSDIFAPGDKAATKRPLDIELGSGFGDWAVHQARSKPERDFVAVELRADRVAQTFARVVLSDKSLSNLCCVGAECGSFLHSRVRKATVSTIFVNHPEPPTQTYGADEIMLAQISEGGEEPGHMLSSDILISAVECLEPREGQLIIVTDNRMYARLICVSLVKTLKSRPALIEPLSINGMRSIESFGPVSLFEGQPGENVRHATLQGTSGQSYFDRLWKTGAGTHAERSKRFIVAVRRTSGHSKDAKKEKK